MNYKCPKCHQISNQESWNVATINCYDAEIYLIEDNESGSLFVCPNCSEESGREDIQ